MKNAVIPGRERERAGPASITRCAAEHGVRVRPFGPPPNDGRFAIESKRPDAP